MKRCGKCGNQNADEMRFCLECGNPLPEAPIVINLQNDTGQRQSEVKTDSYNQSVKTQTANRYVPPDYTGPKKRGGGNATKIFLAVGGVFALFLLLAMGVVAVVVYNLMSAERADLKPPPMPVIEPTRPVEDDSPDPSPEETPTPRPTPTRTPKTTETTDNSSGVTVKFDDIDVDYNVRQDGRLGMLMKVSFTVNGMKDKDSYLAIHFQKKDGTPLPAKPGEYRDVNGNLAAFRSLKPKYDATEYRDLELFLPYDEFKLAKGRHDLKMDVDLLDGEGVLIEHLAFNEFWYEEK